MGNDENHKGPEIYSKDLAKRENGGAELIKEGGGVASGGEQAGPEVPLFDPSESGVIDAFEGETMEWMGEMVVIGFGSEAGGVFAEENVREEDDGHHGYGSAFGFGKSGEQKPDHGT